MPWRCGHALVWDVACPNTFAPSHVGLAPGEAGLVAAQAEQLKNRKYTELLISLRFTPFATETSGVFGPDTTPFFEDLGYSYMVQQVVVAVQQGSAAVVLVMVSPPPPADSATLTFGCMRA